MAQGTRRAAQLSQQHLEDAKYKRGCARCKAAGRVKEAVGHKDQTARILRLLRQL